MQQIVPPRARITVFVYSSGNNVGQLVTNSTQIAVLGLL